VKDLYPGDLDHPEAYLEDPDFPDAAALPVSVGDILACVPRYSEFMAKHSDRVARIEGRPEFHRFQVAESALLLRLQERYPHLLPYYAFRHLPRPKAARDSGDICKPLSPRRWSRFPRHLVYRLDELRRVIDHDRTAAGARDASVFLLIAYQSLVGMLRALDHSSAVAACALAARCGQAIAEGWANLHRPRTKSAYAAVRRSAETRLREALHWLDEYGTILARVQVEHPAMGTKKAAARARSILLPRYQKTRGKPVTDASLVHRLSAWRKLVARNVGDAQG